MSIPPQSLNAWLDHISQAHPHEIELGLDRVRAVYQRMVFSSPPKKTVLVAGTNGKGSTIALAEAGLRSQGYKVGCYTSPHITNYNERVRIGGNNVSDESLIEAFDYIEQLRGDVSLSYFEFGTLAALYLLFNAQLDVVLLEIGLGGRLDAVNVVDGDVSVITSIDIDHVDWLGSDIDVIGAEKAGILRTGQLFLAGENLPDSVFQLARQCACKTLVCHEDFYRDESDACLVQGEAHVRFANSPLLGLPENNVLLAMQLVCSLSDTESFDFSRLRDAFLSCHIPGRLETVSGRGDIVLDVGHNPHAARFLARFVVQARASGKYIELVYSALADKDVAGVVSELAPFADRWVLAPLDADRALSLKDLEAIVGEQAKSMVSFADVGKALEFSCGDLGPEGLLGPDGQSKLVLIFGSFFMIEAAKKYLESYE